MGVEAVAALAGGLKFGADVLQSEDKKRAEKEARNKQLEANKLSQYQVNAGAEKAGGYLSEGQTGLESAYNQGISGFKPYQQAGETALQRYMGLLSGTGYQPSPALNYKAKLLNQYLASKGLSQSQSYQSTGYAPLLAEDYNSQFSNLQPILNMGYGSTGTVAGLYGQIGQGRQQLGTGLSNIESNRSTNLANLISGRGDIEAAKTMSQTPQWGNYISQGADMFTKLYGGNNPMGASPSSSSYGVMQSNQNTPVSAPISTPLPITSQYPNMNMFKGYPSSRPLPQGYGYKPSGGGVSYWENPTYKYM